MRSDNSRPGAYRRAAEVANAGPCDVVSLQHEFGLYSGEWGVDVLDFVRDCHKPIVTTFHTLLTEPSSLPRRIIQNVAARSQGIVVMTEVAARLLSSVYGVAGPHVRVIPHGVPEVPYQRDAAHKVRLGLVGRRVLLHLRANQPRQGAGTHDSRHAADRRRVPRGPCI